MGARFKYEVWLISCLLVCLPWCTQADAASFDCDKAKTTVEKLVCADNESSGLDDRMAVLYKAALRDKVLAPAARVVHKDWLGVRNACVDVACVRSAYWKRIQDLSYAISIEQRWRTCFTDHDCAQRLKRLVPIFAKANGSTESDVIHILSNCETPDRNMRSCMSYGLFELRYELSEKMAILSRSCDDSCGKSISSDHAKWLKSVATSCQKKVENEMEGRGRGLEAQERMLSCEFRATESRLRKFLTLDDCSRFKNCQLGSR